MSAEVLSIGSELVSGQSLDTNSQWISRRLGSLGIPVRFHTTLGDDLAENVAAFGIAAGRCELVIATGGLGPTQDDLTREALAALGGVELVEDPSSLAAISAMFSSRGAVMAERNRVQALFPAGSEPLANRAGTAPGIWMVVGKSAVACLPGVPAEMKIMFDEQVVPRLKAAGLVGRSIVHHKINMFGKGESDIEAQALDLTVRGHVPEVGITASKATISFRVRGEGADEAEAMASIADTLAQIRERFGPLIVGEGEEDVVEGLVAELKRRGATIALAESCTGGLIASQLTEVPGVSECFLGGIVSYANKAKVDLLGVPADLIERHGAVSEEVARAMAVGALERFGSSLALSVTGVAGPGGGTTDKPVGLIYMGLAMAGETAVRRLLMPSSHTRDLIQARTAKHAMNWARLALVERAAGRPIPVS
jgi:nicotinamide-nucleotide amidase